MENKNNLKKKQKWRLLLIIGIIFMMVGALTYQHYKPELKTFTSRSNSSFIRNLLDAISISPIRTEYTGNYKVLSKTGNESLYDVSFEKKQVSLGNIIYYDEELKKNVSFEQFREDTIICLEAGWDEKEQKEVIDNTFNYSVPLTLSFYKTDLLSKQTDITRELEKASGISSSYEKGDTYKFCYQANPEKDFYLKFGDNSVYVIQGKDIVGDSLLTNVTAETGDANFTHLNISTTTPYDSLVGYWSFDGDNVNSKLNKSYDFSKENNDGDMVANAVVNSTNCMDGFGDCLQLDGDGDYVDLGRNFTEYESITFSFWVSVNSWSGTDYLLDNSVGAVGYIIRDTGSALSAYIYNSSGGFAFDSASSVGTGSWHHVVLVHNSSSICLYLDTGDTDCSAWSDENNQVGQTATTIKIGAEYNGANGMNGTIDEVMIFNTSLTTDQILDIYNNQSARFVRDGTQQVRAVNITDTSTWNNAGYNRVNLTTTYETNFGSNISARIGQMNLSVDPDGLVLYMPFEWGSAVDISGKGNDGTLEGDTFFNETGGLNDTGGFEFDGVGDYVSLSKTASIDITGNVTVSAWIKASSTPTSWSSIFSRGRLNGGAASEQYHLSSHSSGDMQFRVSNGTNTLTATGFQPQAGIWYHVAGTFNGTGVTLYVNGGVNATTTDLNFGGVLNSAAASKGTLLGGNYDGRYLWNGTIDEVMFFSRSLSANEISALYGNQSHKYNVAYYTDYQNITGDDEFTINKEADFVFPDFKFYAGNLTSRFYTPLLQGDITLETWTYTPPPVGDTEDPKVYLIAPPNATSGLTQTHSFNATFIDNVNVTNATYYLWNSTNIVNLTEKILGGTKSESWNLTVTLPYADTFEWNFWACDNSSNCAFNATNYTITYIVDSCTCPSINNYWQIDMGDYCNITTNCNLGTGRLNWTGSGWCNCSAIINTTNMARPDANQLLYITKDCVINIFNWFLRIIKTPFLPLIQALSVTNTNLSISSINNSISVDSMTLTKLVINDTSIELYNVSSVGTNFTNVDSTYNATIYFYGLIVNLAVYDVNTSIYSFNATIGNQNYGATFKSKQLLRILSLFITTCEGITNTRLTLKISDGIYPYIKKCYGLTFK